MAKPKDTISRLERVAIPEAERHLADAVEGRRKSLAAITAATSAKAAAVDDADAFHAAALEEERYGREVERFAAKISRAEVELAKLARDLQDARRRAIEVELAAAVQDAHKESERVRRTATAVDRAVDALVVARARVDSLAVMLREADGDPAALVVDEVGWSCDGLAVLAAGARTPIASSTRKREADNLRRAQDREREIERLVSSGELVLFSNDLEQVVAHELLEEARRRLLARKSEALERRELAAIGERRDAWRNGE